MAKKLCLIILFSLLSPHMWAQENGDPTDPKVGQKYLVLYKGITHEETLSELPMGAEFSGDWRGVSKVSVAREYRKLRFTPTKPGIATLSIHDKKGGKVFEYRIEVRETSLTRVVREIRALLNEIEGITVKVVNKKVVVDGKVVHPEDLNRIIGVIKQYGGLAASLVEVSPFAQQKIAQIIEREINNPDITVKSRNGKYILSGEVNSSTERDQAELIARTYIPPPVFKEAEAAEVLKKPKEDPVINLVTIRPSPEAPPRKMIQIVVHYVELSKDYAKSSRFQWTPGIADSTNISFTQDSRQPSGIVATITGTISNLLPKLNWAKAHGHARILKSTNIITEDRSPGRVTEQTQIPYTTVNAEGAIVTNFANVQLVSQIVPTIVNPRSDLISLQMNFTSGSLVGTTSNGPVISSNAVQTKVSVRSGQSAAVAGLIRNSQTMDYNKLPDGIQNPLFSFYSSKAFQKNQSQFVVFVTPIIKASASSGAEKIKEKFRLSN